MAENPTRQRGLIESAIGPSPWYWNTFPTIVGASGQKFLWSYHGNDGELAYLVTLALPQERDKPRLALNTYSRAFPIGSNLLGVWCPEPGALRLLCFDPDQLKAFSLVDVVGWFKPSTERVYSATEPVAELELSSSLPEGTHKIEVPAEFRGIDELLLINTTPARSRDDPAIAIYVLYAAAGLVEVLPQKWFTPNKYEVGRQWIARVVRDPATQRIIGEGVRVGNFELAEDGRNVERWISTAE